MWVGSACCELCKPKNNNMRYCPFQKTETLITADGSDDDLIKPEDLSNYKILSPSILDPEPTAAISSVSHDFEQEEQDELADNFEGGEENFEIVNEKRRAKRTKSGWWWGDRRVP